MARVGESEAGVAGRALGERRGENAGVLVVVIVDFRGGLVRVRAEDPAGVLDQPALEGDRRGEEQGVEGWAVEPLPDIWTGRDGK
jgi:hypothetical protein